MATASLVKLSDADLDALLEESKEAAAKYQTVQQEKFRREAEARNKAEEEKREKAKNSAAYKKLLEKYKSVKESVSACCGTKELTLNVPVNFTYESSGIEDYMPDFDDAFYDGELEGSIAKDSPGVNKKQKVILGEGLGQLLERLRNNGDIRQDLFSEWNDEQKAALDDLKKAAERMQSLCGKKHISVTLPITFKYEVSEGEYEEYGLGEKNFDCVFSRECPTFEIGTVAGLNKKQKGVFEDGIQDIVENACETIYELFHDANKEQQAAVAAYNKVAAEAVAMGLDYDDLNCE